MIGTCGGSHLLKDFYRIAALFFAFARAEANFFGPDSERACCRLRLKRVGDSKQFALNNPNQSGGLIIDKIGWHKPFIIARASGSDYWGPSILRALTAFPSATSSEKN